MMERIISQTKRRMRFGKVNGKSLFILVTCSLISCVVEDYRVRLLECEYQEHGKEFFLWFNYNELFKESIIEKNNNYELVEIQDIKAPIKSVDVLLHDKLHNKKRFIRAYPLAIYGKEHVVNWNEHLNILVDLETFNRYLELRGTHDRDSILTLYISLLAADIDVNEVVRIRSLNDVQMILKKYKRYDNIVNRNMNSIKEEDIESLLNSSEKASAIYWLRNKGVVEFNIEYDNKKSKVRKINAVIHGILGNESISCC